MSRDFPCGGCLFPNQTCPCLTKDYDQPESFKRGSSEASRRVLKSNLERIRRRSTDESKEGG